MSVFSSRAGKGGLFLLLFACVFFAHDQSARAALVVPINNGYVTDTAAILSAAEKSTLEATLFDYKNRTTNEIAIVILPNLEGRSIEEVGLEIGRKWKIGSEGKDNGILLLIDYGGREVRFDVGYGLEGAVPDIVAKGIIDTDLVPNFRNGDYAAGIGAAVVSLERHIGGEYTAERYEKPEDSPVPGIIFLFALFFFQWLVSVLGRTKSWWLGGVFGGIGGVIGVLLLGWWLLIPILIPLGLFLDFVVSKNFHSRGRTSWWAGGGWGPGGGGFGGGRGGFGGFGGGGFGGGGASGRW
ncbi:TPM domain-containing protein [Candidatus Peribacteria bacterium]|nr:TPM domain-containing protein [Candidatus Peribacteria bacterium]